jgi:hypothetical protein
MRKQSYTPEDKRTPQYCASFQFSYWALFKSSLQRSRKIGEDCFPRTAGPHEVAFP